MSTARSLLPRGPLTSTAAELSFGSGWMMAAAMVLIAVGTALGQRDVSTLLLIMSACLAGLAVFAPSGPVLRTLGRRSVMAVLATSLILEIWAFISQSPLRDLGYRLALLVLVGVGLHAMTRVGGLRAAEIAIVIVGYAVLMCVMLGATPAPFIDVYDFQQQGVAALLSGIDPFALHYANTAGPNSPYYAPELVDGDRLTFGFIYPPLSLLMAVPGYIVAGDYRYGAVVALAVAAFLIAQTRPSGMATGAVLVVLFAPSTQFILYWGWTDPFVVLLLALTAFLAARRARSTPLALGLLLASKQYVLPFYLLAVVLLGAVRRRVGWQKMLLLPVLVLALTVLPFVVWNAGALVYSTVTVHLVQPFRVDSLSVPAMLARSGSEPTPAWLGFVLSALVMAAALLKAPRTLSGFCAAGAIVLLVFFLFGKQAFVHYYFLPMALLAVAIATIERDEKRSRPMPAGA